MNFDISLTPQFLKGNNVINDKILKKVSNLFLRVEIILELDINRLFLISKKILQTKIINFIKDVK